MADQIAIESLEELRRFATGKGLEVRLHLNGGLFSRKEVIYNAVKKRWSIYNHIDDTWLREITDEELAERTLIVQAIPAYALSYDPDDVKHKEEA